MKKYVVITISLIFLISCYSGVTSKPINQKSIYNNELKQIYEKSSMQVVPIDATTNNANSIYFTPRILVYSLLQNIFQLSIF